MGLPSQEDTDELLRQSAELIDQSRSVLRELEKRFAEHKNLVAEAFPAIRCLRCGFLDFDIMPNLLGPNGIEVVTLSCQRCGLIEQHRIGILRQAVKDKKTPIPLEKHREK
jgi:hypothetical protein